MMHLACADRFFVDMQDNPSYVLAAAEASELKTNKGGENDSRSSGQDRRETETE